MSLSEIGFVPQASSNCQAKYEHGHSLLGEVSINHSFNENVLLVFGLL
jgi:hypothetical protein